jgi:hypothetical protein
MLDIFKKDGKLNIELYLFYSKSAKTVSNYKGDILMHGAPSLNFVKLIRRGWYVVGTL